MVVNLSVLKLVPQTTAHLKSVFGRHGNVPLIIKTVDVCTKRQPILNMIRAGSEVSLDMGGFKDW